MFSEAPLPLFALLIGVSVIPFLLLGITSFAKFSVVFAILRNALGGAQIPSVAVSTLLAFLLTMQVMAPVCRDAFEAAASRFQEQQSALVAPKVGPLSSGKRGELSLGELSGDVAKFVAIAQVAIGPFEEFLRKHSRQRERLFFAGSGGIADETFISLMPAFLLTELAEAFTLGVMLYLPFLVIDLVVANLLIGLGMAMVSPVMISLPMKLFLFVLCDGWFLLSRGLVMSYGG